MSASPVLAGALAAALSAALSAALTAALLALAATTVRLGRARHELAAARARAATDPLTGLANRRTLTDHLAAALRDGRAVSVAMLDVDQFHHVNDHHGHATGDAVLIQIAGRLTHLGAPVRAAARLSGDEFALLICANLDQAHTVAWRAWHAIADRPIVVGGQPLAVRASIGVACARPGMSTSQLLHHADLATHHAKATGAGVYAHTPDLPDQPVVARPAWRARDLPHPRPLPDPHQHQHR
jgi:diguanylate cyclase (GGDEF)-like protein